MTTKNVLHVNLFFIIMAVLLITVGGYVQGMDFTIGILITEYVLVAGGSIVYLVIKKKNIKEVLRLRKAKLISFVKIFFLAFLMLPVIGLFNVLFMWLIDSFGTLKTVDIPTAKDGMSLLLNVFIIGLTPGICEEIMFRGVILDTYEREHGRKVAALMSALLFAIFHFNLGNFAGPMILGLLYAFFIQVTDSIYVTMFAHFMNNSIAVVLPYLLDKLMHSVTADPEVSKIVGDVALESQDMNFALMVVPLAIVALICGTIAFFIIRSFKKNYPKKHSDLYTDSIDERNNYTSDEYQVWAPQVEKAKVDAGTYIPVGLIVVAYGVLTWLTFFK